MPNKQEVHRGLSLASPTPEGKDVEVLQGQINEQFDHFEIDKRIEKDGDFGAKTLKAAREIAFAMGVVGPARKKLRKGRVSKGTQRLIRGREKTRREKLATGRRKSYRKKLRKRYDRAGGKKAIDWAKSKVGTTESPAGSNWGPRIGEWIKFTGYTGPVPWCGCFAAFAVVKIGGARIPNRIRLGYTGYIVADARSGRNGLREVSSASARAGDIVVFDFGHIGLIKHVDGSTLYTVEGNTSAGESGSQANGGGVFERVRSLGDVVVIARPDYA